MGFFRLLGSSSLLGGSCAHVWDIVGRNLLFLDKHDAFQVTSVAGFHDSHNDFLLVDLFVETGILEDALPADHATVGLGLAQAEHLLVHLLVGCKHPHEAPHILGCFIVAVKEVEKGIELLLVGGQGVPGHLALVESDFLDELADFLEIETNVVVLEVLLDSLQRGA